MRMRVLTMSVIVLAVIAGVAMAQGQQQRASPHETATGTVDGATITVTYGRPYAKGRKIVGGLVPYGQVWRTGADEATLLETTKDLQFGSVRVPAGKYSLYTVAGEKSWTLVINRQTGQWGTEYDEAQDLARVDGMAMPTKSPVEQFEIKVEPRPGGGALHLAWENTMVMVPFTVAK